MSVSSSVQSLHELCWLSLMAACIAATALFPLFIGPVPITLQDCLVIGSGIFLGPKGGAKAVGLYIVAGCIGLPVFSGGRGGIAHVFGPTGGYIIGFVFLAFFSGFTTYCRQDREADPGPLSRSRLFSGFFPNFFARPVSRFGSRLVSSFTARCLACCLVGYVALYSTGTLWLAHTLDISLMTALTIGVLPFLPVTVIKLLILFASLHAFYPQIKRFSPNTSSCHIH